MNELLATPAIVLGSALVTAAINILLWSAFKRYLSRRAARSGP